jgi:hypothetical protein
MVCGQKPQYDCKIFYKFCFKYTEKGCEPMLETIFLILKMLLKFIEVKGGRLGLVLLKIENRLPTEVLDYFLILVTKLYDAKIIE